jgi:hypothetical protein
LAAEVNAKALNVRLVVVAQHAARCRARRRSVSDSSDADDAARPPAGRSTDCDDSAMTPRRPMLATVAAARGGALPKLMIEPSF